MSKERELLKEIDNFLVAGIGESPLTEEEYKSKSIDFLRNFNNPNYAYTSIHGDHRLYRCTGSINDTGYGQHYDRRIVERMVDEGLIPFNSVDIDRVRKCSQ